MGKIVSNERNLAKLKKLLIVIAVILVIFIIFMVITIIISNRPIANVDKFQKVMNQNGYNVIDETSKYSSRFSLVVTSAFLAKNDNCNIRLVDFSSADYSSRFFELSKNSYSKQKAQEQVVSESLDGIENYILETSDSYIRISTAENKVLEANADIRYKKEIDRIFRKLGY